MCEQLNYFKELEKNQYQDIVWEHVSKRLKFINIDKYVMLHNRYISWEQRIKL